MRSRASVIPELNVLITFSSNKLSLPHAQFALLQKVAQVSLLRKDILQRRLLVHEDLEVVGDDVAVLALGTLDQNGAFVVALFGDKVGRTVGARFASECQLIGGLARSRRCFACF